MVGDVGPRAVGGGDRDELALADQFVEQLRVVHDLVVPVQLRVLAAHRVEAVRAGGHDLAGARLAAFEDGVEHLHVLLREHLEEELVAGAAGGVAGAALLGAEHDVVHPGAVQQFGGGADGLAGVVVERARAADPEQVLGVRGELARPVSTEDRHLEVEVAGPVQAVFGVLAPGVALVLQVAEQHAQLGGELRLDEHLVAAHVDDVVDVLDVHRALFHAGPAGGAGPQHVGVDHAALFQGADQRAQRLLRARAGDALVPGLGDAVAGVRAQPGGEVDRPSSGACLPSMM